MSHGKKNSKKRNAPKPWDDQESEDSDDTPELVGDQDSDDPVIRWLKTLDSKLLKATTIGIEDQYVVFGLGKGEWVLIHIPPSISETDLMNTLMKVYV